MKAAVYGRYGPPDVVEVREVPKPETKANEILIKIRASTISTADWRARSLELPPGFGPLGRLVFGVFRPRKQILGTELAGDVEAVGADVTKFKPGEKVFAFPGAQFGCHAQYRTMAEDQVIAPMPENLSYEQAAALSFGGTTALFFLRDQGKLQPGERVLIIGASGCVGTAAVQLAKHFGAHVTGVCSGANMERVRSIGADAVIDYTVEDFTKNGETYDIILNANGKVHFSRASASLAPGGRLLLVLAGLGQMLTIPFASRNDGKRVIAGVAPERIEDLRFLAELAGKGAYTPVIDQSFPLAKIVQAHARVDTGRKIGNVVITMDA